MKKQFFLSIISVILFLAFCGIASAILEYNIYYDGGNVFTPNQKIKIVFEMYNTENETIQIDYMYQHSNIGWSTPDNYLGPYEFRREIYEYYIPESEPGVYQHEIEIHGPGVNRIYFIEYTVVDNQEIPEFTSIGVALALLGASYFVLRKRKQ
jgi:hypothetical protein